MSRNVSAANSRSRGVTSKSSLNFCGGLFNGFAGLAIVERVIGKFGCWPFSLTPDASDPVRCCRSAQ